jgi:hypothetical protein
MGFGMILWRRRASSRRTMGFIYLVLAEGLPCNGVEPISAETIERDLDEAAPGWRMNDVGFIADPSTTSVQVAISGGGPGDRALDLFRALATRHGLEVFDPQGEQISPKDRRDAPTYIEDQQDAATEEQVGVWTRAASIGDADAMNELGGAYSFGEGVREDAALAAQWYARALAAGHRVTMANLAECYRSGEGVARDPQAAIRWFELAGALGNLEALVRLAELYWAGDGLPKDAAAARRVLERALEKDRYVSPDPVLT